MIIVGCKFPKLWSLITLIWVFPTVKIIFLFVKPLEPWRPFYELERFFKKVKFEDRLWKLWLSNKKNYFIMKCSLTLLLSEDVNRFVVFVVILYKIGQSHSCSTFPRKKAKQLEVSFSFVAISSTLVINCDEYDVNPLHYQKPIFVAWNWCVTISLLLWPQHRESEKRTGQFCLRIDRNHSF